MRQPDFKSLKVNCVKVQPSSGNAIVLKVVNVQIWFG